MAWWEVISAPVFMHAYLYHRLFPDHPPTVRPQDIQLPRVSEGTPVPLIYGRCRVRSPSLVWFGNYLAPGDHYTRGPDESDETADHFSIDTLFLLGIGFQFVPNGSGGGQAALLRIFAGDTPVTLSAIDLPGSTSQSFHFGKAFVTEELAIDGVFYTGNSNQDVTDGAPCFHPDNESYSDGVAYQSGTSLKSALLHHYDFSSGTDLHFSEPPIPGYRNQVMLYGHFALGITPEFPSISVEVDARVDCFLGNELPFDANPAAVLFDLLTAHWGKLGLSAESRNTLGLVVDPTDKIDIDSFTAGAITLAAEGNGYSRVFEQADDAGTVVADVLRQMDGMIYQAPVTGRLVLKLVRFDYVINELDDINPDNAEPGNGSWYSIQGWSETINQVRVTFTDRDANYGDGVVVGQNMANVIAQGGKLRSTDIHFPGCCTKTLANRLASRELAVVSRPMVKATVVVNRQFHDKVPGDVVTFTWPKLNIDRMVMRIVSIDLGQLHSNQITLNLMRDVFDVSNGAFPAPT